MSRLLLLAVDGLDGSLLHALADERCRWGQLVHGAPHSPAAHWASVATGVAANRHGLCHPLMRRADGLLLEPPSAADLRAAPLWQRVWQAGGRAQLANWPATLGTRLPAHAAAGSCCVADGFAVTESLLSSGWPLAPEAVAPPEERATVRAARLHPYQVGRAALTALLEGLPSVLEPAARRLLAAWTSVHNLGVHWAAQAGWDLIALRFDGLPEWMEALAAHGVPVADGMAPFVQQLGRMLARYRVLLAAADDASHLLLLSETAAPPLLDTGTFIDVATATGIAPLPGTGMRLAGLGGWLLAGPDVTPGATALPLHSAALHAQLLGMLSLPTAEPVPVVAWQELATSAAHDPVAAAWLDRHGVQALDLSGMHARATQLQAETLAAWAAAQGQSTQAIAALQRALVLAPNLAGLRLMLAQALLLAERGDEARAVLAAMPPTPSDLVLSDLVAALAAPADANVLWQRLIEFAPRPVAAIAAFWLARLRLAQGDAAAAEPLLAAALREDASNAEAWLAWRQACKLLGRHDDAAEGDVLATAVLGPR
jgi:Tfp pilus assembly protein PilF